MFCLSDLLPSDDNINAKRNINSKSRNCILRFLKYYINYKRKYYVKILKIFFLFEVFKF